MHNGVPRIVLRHFCTVTYKCNNITTPYQQGHRYQPYPQMGTYQPRGGRGRGVGQVAQRGTFRPNFRGASRGRETATRGRGM